MIFLIKPLYKRAKNANRMETFNEHKGTKNEKAGIVSAQIKPCFDGGKICETY